MASSISTVGQLVAVIRSELATRTQDNRPTGGTPAKQRLPAKSPFSASNLHGTIGRRIKEIGRDDPNRGRKAFRIFLESILLSQFGENLINDSQFYAMVDHVQESMDADPAVHQMVQRAIAQLLEKAA